MVVKASSMLSQCVLFNHERAFCYKMSLRCLCMTSPVNMPKKNRCTSDMSDKANGSEFGCCYIGLVIHYF